MTPMIVVSAGPCLGSQVGVVTLIDQRRQRRLFLPITAEEAHEIARALERGPLRASVADPGARTIAIHLLDQPRDPLMGVVVTENGAERRARACPAAVAVVRAVNAGLSVGVPDALLDRWGVPIRATRSAAETVPAVFRRFIEEELPAADTL